MKKKAKKYLFMLWKDYYRNPTDAMGAWALGASMAYDFCELLTSEEITQIRENAEKGARK